MIYAKNNGFYVVKSLQKTVALFYFAEYIFKNISK